ncbi:MAG: SurA N-terminal domain-containing protein [Xanthomonadales bacterium]|nr:SurA N-terminal domain-containing protein [Xanthomonadales bacterium]
MRRLLGDAFDPRLFERPEFKREVLERLIEEEAVLIAAERAGVTIPADRLRREILGIEVLQRDGRFDAERYQSLLRAHGLTAQSFEQRLRRELLLRDWVGAGGRHRAGAGGGGRSPSGAARSGPGFLVGGAAAARGRGGGRGHPARLVRGPSRQSPRAGAGRGRVRRARARRRSRSRPSPDEAELRRRYEEQKSRFVPARAAPRGAHPGDAEGRGRRGRARGARPRRGAQARAGARCRLRRAGAGRTRTIRAPAPPAATSAGSSAGITDPAFEEAAFAAEVGAVVGPVRGTSGYHLLRVLEVRPEEGKSFEEVREELAAEFLAGERERRFRELEDRLSDLVYRDPTSLEPVAEELGLEIRTLGPFAREGGEGLASHPEVIAHAFSEPVLIDGQTSEPFAIEPGRVLALRVREHQPARVRPFEEVREQVEREWRADRREQPRARARREPCSPGCGRARVSRSSPPSSVPSSAARRSLGRFAATVDGRIVAEAFRLPRPGARPRLGLAALGDGRYALIAVTAARDADPAAASAEDRRAVREQLLAERAAADRQAFLQALKASLEIRIAEDRLAQL